jgi:predicted transcriptional regulator
MLLKDLIRQATAAKLLDTSPAAVADLIKRGRLKTYEVDDVPHLSRNEVLQFKRLKPGPKPRPTRAKK